MKALYSGERAEKLARRKKTAAIVCLAVLLSGFVTCVVLCTQVRTANMKPLLIATISVSAVSGWVSTMLYRELYRPARAEADHVRGVLQDIGAGGMAEEHTGTLTVSPIGFAIPKSITVHKVKITTDSGEAEARVEAGLLRFMPKAGQRARVQLVRGYVTAVEVCDEA